MLLGVVLCELIRSVTCPSQQQTNRSGCSAATSKQRHQTLFLALFRPVHLPRVAKLLIMYDSAKLHKDTASKNPEPTELARGFC